MSSPVVLPIVDSPNLFIFWCPGCGYCHYIDTKRWIFNKNMEKPTVSPSILIHPGDNTPRCHIFITNGQIRYLNDCTHKLAGQTIDMTPHPGW